jgi:GTP-binding protein
MDAKAEARAEFEAERIAAKSAQIGQDDEEKA